MQLPSFTLSPSTPRIYSQSKYDIVHSLLDFIIGQMLTGPSPYQASLLFSHTLVIHPHTSLSSKRHLHYSFPDFIMSRITLELPNSSAEFVVGHLPPRIHPFSVETFTLFTKSSAVRILPSPVFLNSNINQNGAFSIHSQTSSAKLSTLNALTDCRLFWTHIHV